MKRAGSVAGIAVLLAVLGAWVWIEASPSPRVAPPAGQAIAIDKSPRAQHERKLVIDKLLADGLVRRIDFSGGDTVRVSLRPAFFTIDEDARRRYVDVLYRHYFDGSSVNDRVVLRDARHGNEVGQYNPYSGGLNLYR